MCEKNYDDRVEKFLTKDTYPLDYENIELRPTSAEKSRNTSKKRLYHDPNPGDLSYDAIKDADLAIYIDSITLDTQPPPKPKHSVGGPLKTRDLEPTPWDADEQTCSALRIDDFIENYS